MKGRFPIPFWTLHNRAWKSWNGGEALRQFDPLMPRRLGPVGTLFRTSWRLCCPMAEKCWTYISTHVQVDHRLFMWGILLDHSWWVNVCPLNCQILRWAVLVENTALGETKERVPAFSIPETFRRVPGQDRKWHGGCQPANVVNPCPSM